MTDPFDLDTLPENQKEILKEFSKKFDDYRQPYVKDDNFLLKWLIARKFDIKAAEDMLRNHLKFRKALGQDDPNYRDYRPNQLGYDYYPHGRFGFDKEGHPMSYQAFGNIDGKGLICNMKTSELMTGLFWYQENWKWYCDEATEKFGKRIHQTNCIMDLSGLSTKHLWKPGIQMFSQIAEILQQHCPELVHKFYLINTPSIFPAIFKLIKPILDVNIQNKIFVLGEDYQSTLLNDIDADQLPVYYGGTATDSNGDPKCSEFICYGGDVPLDLYFKRCEQPKQKHLVEVTIGSGKQILIACKAEKPGTVIKWYFEFDEYYDTYDIGFALYRKYNDKPAKVTEMDMVVPYFRLFCGFVPESGEHVTEMAGTYVVQFDNAYSWINGKILKYRIEVDNVRVKHVEH